MSNTIDTLVTTTVSLGSGNYSSTLVVTSAGTVEPVDGEAAGVTSAVANASLSNDGAIVGGNGYDGPAEAYDGGIGVYFTLAGDSLLNDGSISGGIGAYLETSGIGVSLSGGAVGTNTSTGSITGGAGTIGPGNAGTGVELTGAGTYFGNQGHIAGGAGGLFGRAGSPGGGAGGGGAYVLGAATLTNFATGVITGGVGGVAPGGFDESDGGDGGVGVSLSSGNLSNAGAIDGGGGGYSATDNPGAGGAGVSVIVSAGQTSDVTLTNSGSIVGGIGGVGSTAGGTPDVLASGFGGFGGVGLAIVEEYPGGGTGPFGVIITNDGDITGGTGGANFGAYPGAFGGTGGAAVSVGPGTRLTNDGQIVGGTGGYGQQTPGGLGGDGADVQYTTLINTGTIQGGTGGVTAGSGGTALGGQGGYGGVGVRLEGGTLLTSGAILGGVGGTAIAGGTDGPAGYSIEFATGDSNVVVGAGASFGGAIGGFSVGDSIDITNLTPAQVAADFDPATGAITTAIDGTLQFSGEVANLLNFTADGGTGTDITASPLTSIDGPFNSEVFLGSGNYANSLSVAPTGIVHPDGLPGQTAIYSTVTNASLLNSGLIEGGNSALYERDRQYFGTETGDGVNFAAGGTIVNSGSIEGGAGANGGAAGPATDGGIGVFLAGGTLFNSGSILGGAGGTGGSGTGGTGVMLFGGTIITSGSIGGGTGGSAGNTGTAGAAGDALQFASGTAGTVFVEAGAEFSGMIAGFAPGDTIDIANLTPSEAAADFNATTEVLTTPDDGILRFTGLNVADPLQFTNDGGGGTDIVACYRRGTHIMTDRGERSIELLRIGDLVVTRFGGHRPVHWIGRRRYAQACASGNSGILPVLITRGALAQGIPTRDLWVSPEHAMYVEGTLVPARALVNEATIIQPKISVDIEYLHLEFETHDVILAEGAWSESYVDDENRERFDNVSDYARLYPDSRPRPARYCAPRIEDGAELEMLRRLIGVRQRTRADAA